MVNSGNPAHFAVVGDGELRETLRALADGMGIADRVHFLGWRQEMPPVYAALDALALTDRLDRYVRGNTKAFSVVTVPTPAQEQARGRAGAGAASG